MLKLILLAAVAVCIAAQTENQLNQPQDYQTAPAPAAGQDPANAFLPSSGFPSPLGYPLPPGYPYPGFPFQQLGSGSHGGKSRKHKHGGKSKKHKHGGKSEKHKHGGKSRKGSGGKSGKKGKKSKKGKGKKNNDVLGVDPFVQNPGMGGPVSQVVP